MAAASGRSEWNYRGCGILPQRIDDVQQFPAAINSVAAGKVLVPSPTVERCHVLATRTFSNKQNLWHGRYMQ